MQRNNYYFTFGSCEHYPFIGGWIRVIASNIHEACEIFRNHYPDYHEGILNCADYYTEEEFYNTDMPFDGNYGYFCHGVLSAKKVNEEMNVGLLKKIINNCPDEMPVFVACQGFCNYDLKKGHPVVNTDVFVIVFQDKLFITDECAGETEQGTTL